MSTMGKEGTYMELCHAAKMFGFVGMVIEAEQSNNYYNCFEIGLTGNHTEDILKPKIFILFTGRLDSGHFRLLEPTKPKSPSLFKYGKYIEKSSSKLTNSKEISIQFIDHITTENSINKKESVKPTLECPHVCT